MPADDRPPSPCPERFPANSKPCLRCAVVSVHGEALCRSSSKAWSTTRRRTRCPVIRVACGYRLDSFPDPGEELSPFQPCLPDRAIVLPARMLSTTPTGLAHGPQTETLMPDDAIEEEFIKLRDQAIWLRQTINTFNYLFDSDPETERVLIDIPL